MKVAIKKVGINLQIKEDDTQYRTEFAKSVINDYPEYVSMQDGWLFCCVDEEGLLKGLPTNFLMEMNSDTFPLQKIVGDVVFVRCKPVNFFMEEVYDLEIVDLTDTDIEVINDLLSNDTQARLKEKFKDYGNNSFGYELF